MDAKSKMYGIKMFANVDGQTFKLSFKLMWAFNRMAHTEPQSPQDIMLRLIKPTEQSGHNITTDK